MSGTKRPSSVASLRRAAGGTGPQAAVSPVPEAPITARSSAETPQKPARVTLNMPPELYRELSRWTDGAADELGVARVSVQDALRAMLRAGIRDAGARGAVLDELRREPGE
jgi:hypothetical protein